MELHLVARSVINISINVVRAAFGRKCQGLYDTKLTGGEGSNGECRESNFFFFSHFSLLSSLELQKYDADHFWYN